MSLVIFIYCFSDANPIILSQPAGEPGCMSHIYYIMYIFVCILHKYIAA